MFALLVATAAAAPLSCETAVVGGGWAGVYAAWRLVVDSATVSPADLCLFEARAAVGGRTDSVGGGQGDEALTIDVGAYRFGKEQHLPGDLILGHFGLPVSCYEPDCAADPKFNMTLYKIVDKHGRNAGYATPIRRMVRELVDAGARLHYGHELTGIYDAPAGGAGGLQELHFAGGALAQARRVLLNLPRPAIGRLDPASSVFPADRRAQGWTLLRNCTPCFDPTSSASPPPGKLNVKVRAVPVGAGIRRRPSRRAHLPPRTGVRDLRFAVVDHGARPRAGHL